MQALSQHDELQLQRGQSQLQAGDVAGAIAVTGEVAGRTRHPEAMHFFAFALAQGGRLTDAHKVLAACLQIAPGHAPYWNSYGSLADQMGQSDEAIAAFEKASGLARDYIDPLLNLARLALRLQDWSRARQACEQALRIDPQLPDAMMLAGTVASESGDPAQAAKHFRAALAIKPNEVRARHNLAAALRGSDQAKMALAEVERAIADGGNAPETLTLRAHLLVENGDWDSGVSAYRETLARHAGYLDAHETLARLLPQIGQAGEALNSYRAALLANAADPALWRSALSAARDVKDGEQVLAWANEAERNFGQHPDWDISRSAGYHLLGEAAAARDTLLDRYEDHPVVESCLSHSYLCLHDPDAAQRHALAAARLAPLDQMPWAHLSVIWRLLGDEREAWLADYDRFVMPAQIDLPDGLQQLLEDMHQMRFHPAEQSLRGGTQTRGLLFDRNAPETRLLVERLDNAIQCAIAQLPQDPQHPFLGRNNGKARFKGSWSVRLKSNGFHISHVHPEGWLSSALYVALPDEIDAQSGALTFGVPDAEFGYDLPPRRVEVPQVGKLVLFPSYFWHGTLPFESGTPRLTVAFDVLPGAQG